MSVNVDVNNHTALDYVSPDLCCFSRSDFVEGGKGQSVAGLHLRHHSVEDDESEGMGRGLWAAEQLAAGDVLFANLPVAHVLTAQHVEGRCTFCLMAPDDGDVLNQCGKCKYVRYW